MGIIRRNTIKMNQIGRNYREDLDLLKGIAIIAVVLYHMGISPSGYLGVDVFFVINGFLIMPKVVCDVAENRFSYFSFMEKRIVRLLPLVLLVSLFSLIIGYCGMLPDDYENLSESVVATSFFSNNILASITTKNYWDVGNDYKALMHTWYIGILFEFYLVFPLILMLVKWFSKKMHFSFDKYAVVVILLFSIISILLYLNPSVSIGDRFYLLHYRFFELSFGGLAGIWIVKHRQGQLYKHGLISGSICVILIFVIFFGIFYIGEQNTEYNLVSGMANIGESFIPQNILLLLSVILTSFFVISDNKQSKLVSFLLKTKVLCLFGMMSYSIFIWHQPMLAFYRYFITNELTLLFTLSFLVIVFVLSYITYRFIEQKVRAGIHVWIVLTIAFALINGSAFALYLHAGVVRDVPELYVSMDNVHRNMHAEYVDRIYPYDKDFPVGNGKINVLVIGNSFARDWGNILLESDMVDRINLSYLYQISDNYLNRIKQADYIFFFGWKHEVPYYVWENIKLTSEVWGIGTKNFGESNGVIYKNRRRSDYFQQTIKINPNFFVINKQLKKEWNSKYIDLLSLALTDDENVVVFSQNNKYMSQDTRHLSKGGAEYYAKKINFKDIFK